MEYVYAALLLHKAKKEINESSIKKVLEATGVKVDDNRVKALVAALDGVNIEEAIKNASPVMAAPVASATPTQDSASTSAPEKKKEPEKKPEEAAAGLGSLFG